VEELRASQGRWDVVIFSDSFGGVSDQPRALAAALRATAAGGLVILADSRGRKGQAELGDPGRLPDPSVVHAVCLAHGFCLAAPLVDGEVIEGADGEICGDGGAPYVLCLGAPAPQNLTGEYDWTGEFWVAGGRLPGQNVQGCPTIGMPDVGVEIGGERVAAWQQELGGGSFEEYKELTLCVYLEAMCRESALEWGYGFYRASFDVRFGDDIEFDGAVYFGWGRMQEGNRRRSHKVVVWFLNSRVAHVHLVHAPSDGDKVLGQVRIVLVAQLRPGGGRADELAHDRSARESTIHLCRNFLDSAHLACHEEEAFLFGQDL